MVHLLEGSSCVEIVLAASGPAFHYFRQSGIPVDHCNIPIASGKEEESYKRTRDFLENYARKIKPDAVLIGATGFGFGIDEAALDLFGPRVPTFYLQDGWGASFLHSQSKPLAILAVEEEMVWHFQKNYDVQTRFVGPLRFLPYRDLSTRRLRRIGREKYSLDSGKLVCGYFGQPLEFASYVELVSTIADGVGNLGEVDKLMYFLHPGESAEWIQTHLKDASSSWSFQQSESVEEALCSCDLVLSAFSSSLTALTYLQSVSDFPIASGAFCLFQSEINAALKRSSKRELPLEVEKGYLPVLNSVESLVGDLDHLLTSEAREGQWLAAKNRSLPEANTNKTLEVIGALARW